jgi:predicted nucleotidyltransferase
MSIHPVREHPLTREEALVFAEECRALLQEKFGATRVIVFGSAAGQTPWHEGSDLDLAVEGLAPEKYWDALHAAHEIAPRDLEIALVTLENAYPEMRARILGEIEMTRLREGTRPAVIDDAL